MQELLVENCWEEASLNSSEAIQEQTSLNTSRKRKYPVLRTYMRSLTNLIKHTKMSYFIASLAFRRFLCVSSEISTPRSSRLRYSKCLRRHQACSYDILLPEIFFFQSIYAQGEVPQNFIWLCLKQVIIFSVERYIYSENKNLIW